MQATLCPAWGPRDRRPVLLSGVSPWPAHRPLLSSLCPTAALLLRRSGFRNHPVLLLKGRFRILNQFQVIQIC